jgi:hypothetical protein
MIKPQTEEEMEEEIKIKKEKGIESHEYNLDLSFDESIKDYQCMICMSLIKKATEIKTCGHIFCEECIYRWYETSDACPLCKTEMNDEQEHFLVESKFIDRKVSQIDVSCPYCDWKGKYLDFLKHSDPSYESPCRYILVKCDDCDENIKQELLEQHKKESCEHRLVLCNQCDIKVKLNKLGSHIRDICLETEVTCNDKCDFKGKRSEHIVHQEQCQFETVICPLSYMGCSYMIERKNIDDHMENALQSHFLIAEERIKNLEIENKNLRIKLINFEPIDPDYPLDEGDMIKYKRHGNWIFCTIIGVEAEELELETDEGDIIEVSRHSDRLRLLQ